MVMQAEGTVEVATSSEGVKEKIKHLLETTTLTPLEISAQVGCSFNVVGGVMSAAKRAEVAHSQSQSLTLRDTPTSNRLEGLFVRKLESGLKTLGAKDDSAADFKNKAQGCDLLAKNARLFADQSTSNVSNKSLAMLVSRKGAGKTVKTPKDAPAPKDAEVIVDPEVKVEDLV